MTDEARRILTQAGVDLDSGKKRMMGNEKLLLRMLFKVDGGKSYADLKEAFRKQDVDGAIQTAHALKGLFGSLSVTKLYDLFSRQTALLRSGEFSAAEAMLPEIKGELEALQLALTRAKEAEEKG